MRKFLIGLTAYVLIGICVFGYSAGRAYVQCDGTGQLCDDRAAIGGFLAAFFWPLWLSYELGTHWHRP